MTLSRSTRPRSLARGAFTLIELLTVITIIVILVGLIVGAAGFANTKAGRSRAEGEIKALSAAAENYKADNGIYPRSPAKPPANAYTDNLDAKTQADPDVTNKPAYGNASRDLYALLTGQVNATSGAPITNPTHPPPAPASGVQNYFGDLKPGMLLGVKDGKGTVTAIKDPFGMSYGYSTANAADLEDVNITPDKRRGYNPTFDLWSVANKPSSATTVTEVDKVRPVWITNW